jgi:hypothetical protein
VAGVEFVPPVPLVAVRVVRGVLCCLYSENEINWFLASVEKLRLIGRGRLKYKTDLTLQLISKE